MKRLRCVLALVCCAGAGRGAAAQAPVPATTATADLPRQTNPAALAFVFVPREGGGPAWQIRLDDDRNGSYAETGSSAPARPMHVNPLLWKRLEAGTKAVRNGHCETRQKGIAQTGAKTYSLGDGASCSFNFSDDETLNDAASAFQALAAMMQMGTRLQHDHRFDKLALDADMDTLLGESAAGRALEPGNIAAVLQGLAEDDHVIERVRRKAARLLQDSGLGDKAR